MRIHLFVALLISLVGCSSGGSGSQPSSSGGSDEVALPLIGDPPPGLTEDVLQMALDAAEQGLGYDFATDQLVSLPVAPSQVLVRPGVQIFPESIFPGWCTGAFVFDDRTRIATAGHCTQVGDAVLALTLPTTVFVMGHTSSSTGPDSELGNDWALIDIEPEWRPFTDPAVAFVGGPCGRADDPLPLVKFVGHGVAGTPRYGVLTGEESGAFVAIGPSVPGDSGAPVLETTQTNPSTLCVGGGAVGILTHGEVLVIGGIEEAGIPTGFFLGTPISRIGNSLDDGALLP